MIKENPDDLVHDEQNGVDENAAGNEKIVNAEEAEKAERVDLPAESPETEEKPDEKKEEGEKVVRDNSEVQAEEEESPESEEEEETEDNELPPVDYSGFSKQELVDTLGLLIENRPPAEIRDDVERIKSYFYKKLRHEAEERKNKFIEEGCKIEEYKSWVDPLDDRIKELLGKYREKKNDYNKIQEAEKYENLKKKYDIIDKIKDLVNREESINKTFQEFRAVQNEWHW